MKIGFDAKRLFHNNTGLGVYSRMLVQHLQKSSSDLDLILYDRSPTKGKYHRDFVEYTTHSGSGPLWRTWRVSGQIANDHCDIYHGLSHELPLRLDTYPGIGKVVTIHDLIFEQYPELYSPFDRRIYRWKWQHATRIADAIICISEATKETLLRYYPVNPDKIYIVPPMHDEQFEHAVSDVDAQKVRKEYELPDRYLLSVGSVIERKNLQSVIEAMSRISPAIRLPLVVVGQGKQYLAQCKERANQLGLEQEIIWCHQVPNHALPPFYALATASIYMSHCEGFGIPILESLYAGTPVITSDRSSLPEAAGPGGLLVDPGNIDGIAEAIEKLTLDQSLGKKLVDAAGEHLAKHKNQPLAAKVIDIYEQISGSKHL